MSTADHTLFAQIVGLNGIAFGERRYGMAYHLLMAALHCAEDAADEARLAEVATRFRDHRDRTDALVPPHKYSTGATHMGRSIFDLGASQAESVRSRIQSVERIRRNQPKLSER